MLYSLWRCAECVEQELEASCHLPLQHCAICMNRRSLTPRRAAVSCVARCAGGWAGGATGGCLLARRLMVWQVPWLATRRRSWLQCGFHSNKEPQRQRSRGQRRRLAWPPRISLCRTQHHPLFVNSDALENIVCLFSPRTTRVPMILFLSIRTSDELR